MSRQRPTDLMRFPEIQTAPSSMGGCATGNTTRARRSIAESENWRDGNARRKTNAPALPDAASESGFLAPAFGAGGLGVFAGFVFALALADLLLDFFGDEINRGVEVALGVLGKKVGARHGEPHGTVELFFRSFSMVMFERHARVNGEAVEVVEFVDPRHDMVLDGFGERHVVGRENQFHERMMVSTGQKIQSKRFVKFVAQEFVAIGVDHRTINRLCCAKTPRSDCDSSSCNDCNS